MFLARELCICKTLLIRVHFKLICCTFFFCRRGVEAYVCDRPSTVHLKTKIQKKYLLEELFKEIMPFNKVLMVLQMPLLKKMDTKWFYVPLVCDLFAFCFMKIIAFVFSIFVLNWCFGTYLTEKKTTTRHIFFCTIMYRMFRTLVNIATKLKRARNGT